MYKDGRNWVIAGMAALTFAVLGIQQTTTYADTEAPAVATNVSAQQTDAKTSVATLQTSDASQATKTTKDDATTSTTQDQKATTTNVPVQNMSAKTAGTTSDATEKVPATTDGTGSGTTQSADTTNVKSQDSAAQNDTAHGESTNTNTTNTEDKAETPETTNLGAATSAQIAEAQSSAKAKFLTTGVAQKVTAVDADPQVTGQVTVKYVDDKGQQIVLSADEQNDVTNNGKNKSATFFNGNLVLTTTVPADQVTTKTVLSRYFDLTLPGYTWVNTDSDQTYAAVGTPKTIEDHYKANAATGTTVTTPIQQGATGQVTVKYVDENNHQIELTTAQQNDWTNDGKSTSVSFVDGDLVLTTTVPAASVPKKSVRDIYFPKTLGDYTYVSVEPDITFAPVADNKVVIAHYKSNSTTTGSTRTTTATPTQQGVTGEALIKYVDKDTNQPISFVSSNSTQLPVAVGKTVDGSYLVTTKLTGTSLANAKIVQKYLDPRIPNYEFVDTSTKDLTFGPVDPDNIKVITAYFKNTKVVTPVKPITKPDPAETGEVTVKYVDQAGQPITFNSDESMLPISSNVLIDGSYDVKVDSTQSKLPGLNAQKYAQAGIFGYAFLGDDTTDFSFVKSGLPTKTITATYQKLAPVLVQYVNADDPSDVIYTTDMQANDPVNRVIGGEDYDFSLHIPDFYGYTYDASATDQQALKGEFVAGDQPQVVRVAYKKTNNSVVKGSQFVDSALGLQVVPDGTVTEDKVENPSTTYGTRDVPQAAVEIVPVVDAHGKEVKPAGYENWTLYVTSGYDTPGSPVEKTGFYIANQPVEVKFVDQGTNAVMTTLSLGEYNPAANILPVGQYNTDTNAEVLAQQAKFVGQQYKMVGVAGRTVGVYDKVHRVVYYYFVKDTPVTTPTDTGYIPTDTGMTTQPVVNPSVPDVTDNTTVTSQPGLPSTFGTDPTDVKQPQSRPQHVLPVTGTQQGTAKADQRVVATNGNMTKAVAYGAQRKMVGRSNSTAQLPQTGETKSSITSIIGLALASLFGIFGLGIKHRKAN